MAENIELLITGYKKFKEQYFRSKNRMFHKLTQNGQKPKVMFIACSDSRVDPAIVTNCQPGDLFVIRNVANLVPPYEEDNSYHGTSAALEFGVCGLDIKHIIVFGHTKCGGITSLFESTESKAPCINHFISKWMDLAAPARDIVLQEHTDSCLEEKINLCGEYSLLNSINNLKTFPWIKEKLQNEALSLHAWYFDLSAGVIKCYNDEKKCFIEIG